MTIARSWLFGAFTLVSLTACRTRPSPSADAAPPKPPTLTSAATPESPTVRARMRDHDAHGLALRNAIARGDLDAARREAKVLAELRLDDVAAPPWRKHLDAMNSAAARLADAKDLAEASRQLPAVARACGDCHSTLGRPGPAVEEPPAAGSGVQLRMRRHQWAADRLWDGLVIPSNDAWTAGARVLADAPLEPEALTPGKTPVPKVDALARAVRDDAHKASAAKTSADRGAVYGEVIASCSSCHQWLGGGPPGERK